MSIRNSVIVAIAFFVTIVGLNSVFLFSWIEKSQDYSLLINEAGKLRMLSQKMAKEAILYQTLRTNSNDMLIQTQEKFSDILQILLTKTQQKEFNQGTENSISIAKQFMVIHNQWRDIRSGYLSLGKDFTLAELEHLSLISNDLLKNADTAVTMFERQAEDEIVRLKKLSVFIFFSSMLAGIFTFNYLRRAFIARIGKISFTAKKITKNPDRGIYIHDDGIDELADLAHSFNVMVEHLVVAQNELKEKAAEAEKANRIKSEFLANMSHELRTPMNAIYGFAQILTSDARLSAQNKEDVTEIINASKHLLALINDLLDLAKIESQTSTLSMESVDVYTLVTECVKMTKVLANERQIEIIQKVSEPAYVYADRVALKKIVLNLLSNAIKYNRPQGQVIIDIDTTKSLVSLISITDTGYGMDSSDLPQLFQIFTRLESSNHYVDGTGIGLVLSKNLVEQMKGHINVKSEQGKGSIFTISLASREAGSQNIISENAQNQYSDKISKLHDTLKIVCIDDSPSNIKLMDSVFAGYQNIEIYGSVESLKAISLIKARMPDIILLDIYMPVLNGFEVLNEIKKDSSINHIPVIAISANIFPKNIQKIYEAGFNDFLGKPIDIEELIDKLLACKKIA